MARPRKATKPTGGRGSAQAIEKRRVARQLNAVLTGGSPRSGGLDGRTEKRRQRLIKELADGKNGKALKPIDVVAHVDELLEIGETLSSLKKQGVKPQKTEITPEVMEVVKRTQHAYGFRPDAWKMLGLAVENGASRAKGTKTSSKPAKKRAPRKRGRASATR